MNNQHRAKRSEYMAWARQHAGVKYNLATSGVMNMPASMLPVRPGDLELTGSPTYGYKPLVDALAAKCDVAADRVFTTLGTSMANHLAFAACLEPGDHVLMEFPAYELLLSTASYLGAVIDRVPRRPGNDFRVVPADIERALTSRTRLIVLTNLHNPTSALIEGSALREIGAIARHAGVRVLVDEVYLDGAPPRSRGTAARLGDEFIVTSSLTKIYGLSGLRCGWILADPALISSIWHLNDLFYVNHAHPAERLSVIALAELGRIGAWAHSILEANQEAVASFLAARSDLECFMPGHGTVVFPRLKNGSVEKLYDILTEKFETAICPGRFFEMSDHFRIGLGGDPGATKEGLVRLGKALDEIARG